MMDRPQPPFDALALDYDRVFTESPIARLLRDRVHARLLTHFSPGSHVLELGCGTGEDARFLAAHGVAVTATDSSEAMLAAARAKLDGDPLVVLRQIDLQNLPALADPAAQPPYAGVFASFGPLNCVGEWRSLARWLAAQLAPGAVAAFGVMPPFCAWEMLWHGAHGEFAVAFRRWRQGVPFQLDGAAGAIPIYYPTARRLTQHFAPYFERTYLAPLGLFLPPSDVYGVVENRPRLLAGCAALERWSGSLSFLAMLADHYWIEFRRRG